MMSLSRDHYLADLAGVLLRYYREGERFSKISGSVALGTDDNTPLLMAWARSEGCVSVVEAFRGGNHAIRKEFKTRDYIGDNPRGRLLAARSGILQLRRGNPTMWVSEEQAPSEENALNDLLRWTLRSILQYTRAIDRACPIGNLPAAMQTAVKTTLSAERQIRSFAGVGNVQNARRPSRSLEAVALRARSPLYRAAAVCLKSLRRLIAHDPDELMALLVSTVLTPYEVWRLFELWVAVRIGETIAQCTGYVLELRTLLPSMSGPIMQVGPYSVYWQRHGPDAVQREAERDEALTEEILNFYGLETAADRPDIIVTCQGKTVAILEVKYFGDGADWTVPFVGAIRQIVRYSRRYRDRSTVLGNSAVVMAHCPPAGLAVPRNVPRRFAATDLRAAPFSAYVRSALACAP